MSLAPLTFALHRNPIAGMFLTPSVLSVLAHDFIPSQVQQGPLDFFMRMAYERQAYVDWMIEQVATSPSVDLSCGQPTVTVSCCSTGKHPAVLFIFNRPTRPTEPFLAAVVAHKALPELSVEPGNTLNLTMAPPRYFLMEATAPDEGTASRLCEWRDGTHFSHGEAPPLTVASFFEAVNRLMAEPGSR